MNIYLIEDCDLQLKKIYSLDADELVCIFYYDWTKTKFQDEQILNAPVHESQNTK